MITITVTKDDEFLLERYPGPHVFINHEHRVQFFAFTEKFYPISLKFINFHGSGEYLQFWVSTHPSIRVSRKFSFLKSILEHLDPITL